MRTIYICKEDIMVKLAMLGIAMYIAARIIEIFEAWTEEAEEAGAVKK